MGNSILWKFSLIYESCIPGVKAFFCYHEIVVIEVRNIIYKYMQNEQTEKCKRHMMGLKGTSPSKEKENWRWEKKNVTAFVKFILKKRYMYV